MFPEKVAQWFSLRGIPQDTLKRFNIWWNGREIVIPIKDEKGKTLFNKYRRSPESTEGPKYRNETGSHVTIFNPNALDSKTVILCEGEADVLRLETLGYPAISSTGGSQSFKKDWVHLLNNKELYICYDADDAGIKGAIKTAWLLFNNIPVKLIAFPEYFSGKDITDYLQHHSKEEFDVLIKNAIELPQPKLDDTKSISKALTECSELRKVLKSHELSTALLEEHIRILNQAKEQFKKSKVITEKREEITSIKEVPISNFVQFDPSGFAKRCIWHSPAKDQKTPSLHYYKKTNTVYCFACNTSGDVISVVRHLNNCSFVEAVEILKKYI